MLDASNNLVSITGDTVSLDAPPQSAITHETYAHAGQLIDGTQSDCPFRKWFIVLPFLPDSKTWVRIQLADPWRISTSHIQWNCTFGEPGTTCLVYQPNLEESFNVYTDDPNAPPVNVYVESSVTELPACP
jgi:hypothetical protein